MRLPRFVFVILVVAMIAAACGGDDSSDTTSGPSGDGTTTTAADNTTTTGEAATTTTEAPPAELIPITYATSFGLFGRDAYAHVALEKGYFEEAGFDVTIVPGSGSVNNAQLVASGQLDFAPADFSALVLLRANEDVPVRAVSFIHQQGLAAIMTKADSGINTPADLPGRTLADIPGSVVVELFPAYAERVGIDPDSVEFIPAEPQQLPGLLASDQVDAVNQFVVGKPLFENVTEGDITVFPYSEFFPELPGIAIVVSEDKLASDPDQIAAFIGALNRGLQDAIDNPAEAGQILNQVSPESNADVAAAELTIMAGFVTNDYTDANGIGTIDVSRIEAATTIILNAFGITTPLAVDDLYVPAG